MNKNRLLKILSNHYEDIFHPAYVRYTKEWSMSPVDPSYIYPYIVGGVKKPKLSQKMLKIKDQYDEVYEYGFNKNDQCLYCKRLNKEGFSLYTSFYIHVNDVIYRIEIKDHDFHQSKMMSTENYHRKLMEMKNFDYCVFEEYHFDEYKRPLKIICNYWGIRKK